MGVMTGRGAAGAACSDSVQCANTLYCNKTTGTCAPLLAVGQPCTTSDQCSYRAKGRGCDGSTCVALLADGASCSTSSECSSGLCNGTCTTTAGTPFTGSACASMGGELFTCPGGRYTVLDRSTAGCTEKDGSGLVRDNNTGLTWQAKDYRPPPVGGYAGSLNYQQATDYCESLGMRLPSRTEAQAIAGAGDYDACAFPCTWATWTYTSGFGGVPGSNPKYTVSSDGYEASLASNSNFRVLCVK